MHSLDTERIASAILCVHADHDVLPMPAHDFFRTNDIQILWDFILQIFCMLVGICDQGRLCQHNRSEALQLTAKLAVLVDAYSTLQASRSSR